MEDIDLSEFNLPEKEEKILKASIEIFSIKGFNATTTKEIAKSAGIAEGTIYRYFKTKKDILRKILIHTINIFSKKIVLGSIEKILIQAKEKNIREILKEILYDRLKLIDSIFNMAQVVFTEAMMHDDVREAIYQNIISGALEMFREFHQNMQDKNILRDDVETEVIFRSILGNMAVFIAQTRLFADKFDIKDIDKELDKMIDVLLYGIVKK